MPEANEPKKETVRIKLPPRHGVAGSNTNGNRDTIRINLPPRAPSNLSAGSVTPKPPPIPPSLLQTPVLPGLGHAPKPPAFPLPSIVESVPSPAHSPSISEDLAEAPLPPPVPVAKAPPAPVSKPAPPSKAKTPTARIAKVRPAPNAKTPTVAIRTPAAPTAKAPPAPIAKAPPAPIAKAPTVAINAPAAPIAKAPTAPLSPLPGPKKETARIVTMPEPQPSAPTVKMSKTQPLITAPDPEREMPPISIAPPSVDDVIESIPVSLCWALLAVSALLFIVQLWTYLS
jgi:hypothetical protein